MLRALVAPIKWVVALGLLAGLLGTAYWVHDRMQRRARQASEQAEQPKRIESNQIKLSAELAESHLIETTAAKAGLWYEFTTVYGRIVPNPRASFELRSPHAGTLRPEPDRAVFTPPARAWPAPAEIVRRDQVLAWLEVRANPTEILDLQAKLEEGRQKVKGAKDVLQIRQELVNRLEAVRKENSRSVSQRDWDEAQIGLAEARAQLGTSESAVRLWHSALEEIAQHKDPGNSSWSRQLTAPAAGEITEVAAQAGTAVEAGGLVLRIVDFSRPLVRLDFPPELLADGPPPKTVTLTPITARTRGPGGATDGKAEGLYGELLGPAAQVDTASQFAGYLYEAIIKPASPSRGSAPPDRAIWRPGLFVKSSQVGSPAQAREVIAVPAAALLYHQGRTLVYVSREAKAAEGKELRIFERREVRLLGRQGDTCMLEPRDPLRDASAFGVEAGDAVVSQNAQMLLSEEFRSDVDD